MAWTGNLARGSASTFALASTIKIAFVHFNLTTHLRWRKGLQLGEDDFSEFVEKQNRRVAIDPCQLC